MNKHTRHYFVRSTLVRRWCTQCIQMLLINKPKLQFWLRQNVPVLKIVDLVKCTMWSYQRVNLTLLSYCLTIV